MALVRDGQWMLRETPADLILSGACGVGKSFLAGCCANYILDRRHSVYFIRAGRLFMDLKVHRVNNTLEKRKAELKRIDLLILDDFFDFGYREARIRQTLFLRNSDLPYHF